MQQKSANYLHILYISAIFAFRMLGLFMILPIFSIYADELKGANHVLMGIGFGIYGLTQAILQIPLGYLSDKIGRKKVIILGLGVFALGSVICANSENIYALIIGRAIQGAGAIGSTLIALIADLTPEKSRTKSMALLGMIIGISFSVAVITGPIIARNFGFHAVFSFMTCLAFLGILMTVFLIPTPNKEEHHPEVTASLSLFSVVFSNKKLTFLNISIFFQHMIFTAIFYAIPLILEKHISVQWHFYLPIMIGSFLLAVPLIILGEKKNKIWLIYMICISNIAISAFLLSLQHSILGLFALFLFLYFISFNALEACLPSSVTKVVEPTAKGTAMGIYSMSQFIGIFIGGTLAGHLVQWYGVNAIFIMITVISVIWLAITYLFRVNPINKDSMTQKLA